MAQIRCFQSFNDSTVVGTCEGDELGTVDSGEQCCSPTSMGGLGGGGYIGTFSGAVMMGCIRCSKDHKQQVYACANCKG